MRSLWDSEAFVHLPEQPGELAKEVAVVLGQRSLPVVEVLGFHLEALDCALSLGVPELLADQMRWQTVRLHSAGTPFVSDEVHLAVRAALSPYLDTDGRKAVEDLHHAASALEESMRVADGVELGAGRARDYLHAALAGRRDDAVDIVRAALDDDMDVSDIMLTILQPAQVELGRLWETGEISIAHEHYTTAVTQLSLSLLYPRLLLDRTLHGRSVVAATIGSEAHEVGIRMVSDVLEHGGWRTAYLGADVPGHDVVDQVAEQRADVLAVSATMAGHVRGVRHLIAMLRADPRCERTKALVGGRPFGITPRLGSLVGADGWAPDARQALELCRRWMEERVDAG
jgi:methanogenic corrinoid protein MtbC1